jgi:hypothetical protein
MKFAIATAILVQTMPITSAKPDGVLLPRRAERRRRMQGMFMKHAGGSMVAPIESPLLQLNNHDTDEHMPAFADRSSVQVSDVLKNTKHSSTRGNKKVECDPSLEELDVGILSCGMGQHCKESADSLLGGLCEIEASSSFSRILQEDRKIDYMSLYCESERMNCNCNLVNGETQTGTILCNPYPNCCAPDDQFCVTTTYNIGLLANYVSAFTGCYEFTAPYSRSVCYSGSDGYCEMTIDDETCTSCNVVSDEDGYICAEFDCTNIDDDAVIAGNFCNEGPVPIHDLFSDVRDSSADLVCSTDVSTSTSKSKAAKAAIAFAVLIPVGIALFFVAH